MKITRVRVFSVTIPPKSGGSSSGSGFLPHVDTSVVVLVDTDTGITGAGETCPIGTHDAPAFSQGAEAGIPIVADPFHVEKVNREWDRSFNGSLYLRPGTSSAGRPDGRCALFSVAAGPNRYRSTAPCCSVPAPRPRTASLRCSRAATTATAISSSRPAAPTRTPASLDEAIRFAQVLRNLESVVIEQPCPTLKECIHFRRHCPLPVKLDEVMTTPQDLIRACALDVCCINVARVGGLTKAFGKAQDVRSRVVYVRKQDAKTSSRDVSMAARR